MSSYDTVLEIVAEHPGIETNGLQEIVSGRGGDPEAAVELLEQAVESNDVVEAAGKHWIVRKGKYSYDSYDHEITDSE